MNTSPIIHALTQREEQLRASADSVAQVIQQAMLLADRAVIADIEQHATFAGRTDDELRQAIWDLRPMLDVREHAPEVVDMASQAVAYAWARGLIQPAYGHPQVVIFTRSAE